MKLIPVRCTLATFAVLFSSSCSHGNSASGSSEIVITVQPSSLTLAPGLSVPLAATVTGASDVAITWSMTEGLAGGSVTQNGLYTAPVDEGTYHVVATSHAESSKTATAKIVVTAMPLTTEPSGGASGAGGLLATGGTTGTVVNTGGMTGTGGITRAGGNTGGSTKTGGTTGLGGITGTGGVVSACGVGVPTTGTFTSGAVTAVLVASRNRGCAPLAVHFDATESTSTTAGISDPAQGGTFRQIKHAFDFGDRYVDPNSSTHSISGLSKNSEPSGGGLAAHVYDTAGTYVVKVTSTDGSGSAATAFVTITVDDPSGLPTYAISKTGSFTGAPPGSKYLTQSSLPKFDSNSRYFFNRGEDWTGTTIDIEDNLANIHIDAYGTGAKPIFDGVKVGAWRPATANFATDIRVNNLTLTSSGPLCNIAYRVLFYNVDAVPGANIGTTWIQDDPKASIPLSEMINVHELFFVNCQLLGNGTSSNYTLYGNSSRLVVLNSYTGGTGLGDVRLTAVDRGVIRHCKIESPYTDNTVHALKLHSGGPNAYNDNWLASGGAPGSIDPGYHNWMTNKVVFANNQFGGGNNGTAIANWTVAICPQNDGYGLAGTEPIQDVIVENNNFIHAAAWGRSNVDIAWAGRRLTNRGNSVVQGSGSLVVGKGHAQVADYDGPYFTN